MSEIKNLTNFCTENKEEYEFPCQLSEIETVSLAIGTGGLALIFVFFLMHKVCLCVYLHLHALSLATLA